jgi:putative FmdB family regulatory protein
MKVFEYKCEKCGVFDLVRPLGLRSHPGPCPECGKLSQRIISIPNMSQIDKNKKDRIERNIKAQHQPHICGVGCDHEDHVSTPSHSVAQPKFKEYTGPRPWVIEHAK